MKLFCVQSTLEGKVIELEVKSVHVDWISSSHILDYKPMDVETATEKFTEFVNKMSPEVASVFKCDGWETAHGRRPYSGGYHNQGLGVFVWMGGHENVLIEISGKGVQKLRDADVLNQYMLTVKDRVSRLDIAIDCETEKRPPEIVSSIETGRFKSRSSMTSQHGETEYIGSRQSDRYCRVYRYNDPHPRHKLLRTEFVIKKPHCEYAIESIFQMGRSYVAQQMLNTFGLGETMNVSEHNETMPATRNDRKNSKTEAWLIRQAAPAFQRLVHEGTIEDWREWLERHFLGEIVDMDGN